jgi:hypothetical protein
MIHNDFRIFQIPPGSAQAITSTHYHESSFHVHGRRRSRFVVKKPTYQLRKLDILQVIAVSEQGIARFSRNFRPERLIQNSCPKSVTGHHPAISFRDHRQLCGFLNRARQASAYQRPPSPYVMRVRVHSISFGGIGFVGGFCSTAGALGFWSASSSRSCAL